MPPARSARTPRAQRVRRRTECAMRGCAPAPSETRRVVVAADGIGIVALLDFQPLSNRDTGRASALGLLAVTRVMSGFAPPRARSPASGSRARVGGCGRQPRRGARATAAWVTPSRLPLASAACGMPAGPRAARGTGRQQAPGARKRPQRRKPGGVADPVMGNAGRFGREGRFGKGKSAPDGRREPATRNARGVG